MRIAFVSTMQGSPWGGSEELWSQSAIRLARLGHQVAASVPWWPRRRSELNDLKTNGVLIHERKGPRNVVESGIRLLARHQRWAGWLEATHRWLREWMPDLACISNGGVVDDIWPLRACRFSAIPYVNLSQANAEMWWPTDGQAWDLVGLMRGARRVFFVSNSNRLLLETQLGISLDNAEVVFNPFNVRRNAGPPWPDREASWNLACVGRLEPISKGQDLLFQVLATERWRQRPIRVSLFGRGHMEEGLRRLAARLHLNGMVDFVGHVDSIEDIWKTHHALIMPSRHEGLPLALVEAMLCCRVPIVTDVAGNADLVVDGLNGFLAPAPTASLLAETMERAWQRRQDWQAMGLEAGRIVRERIPEDPVGYFCERLLKAARH